REYAASILADKEGNLIYRNALMKTPMSKEDRYSLYGARQLGLGLVLDSMCTELIAEQSSSADVEMKSPDSKNITDLATPSDEREATFKSRAGEGKGMSRR